MTPRNLGFTFGKTEEGDRRDYEELERRLAEKKITPPADLTTPDNNPPQTALTNGWLYVPSIGMEFSPDLEGFNSNWYDSHKLARSKGFVMPSPYETWALIFEAKANLSKPEFRKVYEFFTRKTPKDTWHGEWQDAFFKVEEGKMYMYGLKGFNPKGEPEFHNKIDITQNGYLTKDGYADISQRANITPQGLCKVADSRKDYVEGEWGWQGSCYLLYLYLTFFYSLQDICGIRYVHCILKNLPLCLF